MLEQGVLRCQKCQTAMNHSDDLTLPQMHIDMLDIDKLFTSQILLQEMLFLKKNNNNKKNRCQ